MRNCAPQVGVEQVRQPDALDFRADQFCERSCQRDVRSSIFARPYIWRLTSLSYR
jgi:hypothetical protein